jgi:WD40 repeat protein
MPSQSWSIKWSTNAARFLLFDEDHVRIFDLCDETWTATISNGSGGMGKIANVTFGRTMDEVLVFSDFGSKVTVWNLQTRRTVEIRDPKFATKGFGHRSAGGSFALLSRSGAQDVLTIHAPNTYELLRTSTLLTTDAQGLKWSPDGRWIVVWDTPSIGYKVHIFTADGHLYRTYSGPLSEDIQGLGVKSVEWSPRGDFLAIGGHDRRVTLLSTRTVG